MSGRAARRASTVCARRVVSSPTRGPGSCRPAIFRSGKSPARRSLASFATPRSPPSRKTLRPAAAAARATSVTSPLPGAGAGSVRPRSRLAHSSGRPEGSTRSASSTLAWWTTSLRARWSCARFTVSNTPPRDRARLATTNSAAPAGVSAWSVTPAIRTPATAGTGPAGAPGTLAAVRRRIPPAPSGAALGSAGESSAPRSVWPAIVGAEWGAEQRHRHHGHHGGLAGPSQACLGRILKRRGPQNLRVFPNRTRSPVRARHDAFPPVAARRRGSHH